MHQDYTKICRVCMSDGSRDIFHKPSVASDGTTTNAIKAVSPLERLLEKLRYVTMMKIEENDDLPRLLCDLCIVQLNVAYNFKRQAVENDTKLRQYFIENGISSNQAMMTEAQSLRSSFAASNVSQARPHQHFPIVPLIVKTEPSDVDAFSDVTTETNVEIDRSHFQSNGSNTINSSPEEVAHRSNNSIYTNERSQSSMVYVNSGYEFNSITPSSDIEFIQNYHMNANKDDEDNTPSSNVSKNISNAATNVNLPTKAPTLTASTPIRVDSQTDISRRRERAEAEKRKKKSKEIDNLSINMVPSTVITNQPREQRRKLGKTTRVPPQDDKHTNSDKSNSQHNNLSKNNLMKASNNSLVRKSFSTFSLPSAGIPLTKSLQLDRRYKLKTSSSSLQKEMHISKSKRVTQKLVLLNPFNASKNAKNVKGVRKSDQISKKKTASKLLRPKIEPPITKKN